MIERADIERYLIPLEPIPTDRGVTGHVDGPIQCLLFDIYGTLFISGSGDVGTTRRQADRNDRLAELLRNWHVDVDAGELLERYFNAIEARHMVLKQSGEDYPEVIIDRIWAEIIGEPDREKVRRFSVAFELIMNPVWPMPGLAETLSECRRRGLRMGIISNAQFFTPLLFDWFLGDVPEGIGFDPDLLFYSFRFEAAKPSPILFNAAVSALQKLGIPESAVLYVGNDMLNDIYPAWRAGFRTALFAGDARSLRTRDDRPECRDLSPDLVINRLEQIFEGLSRP